MRKKIEAAEEKFIPRLPLQAVEKLKRGTTIRSKKKHNRKTDNKEIQEILVEE